MTNPPERPGGAAPADDPLVPTDFSSWMGKMVDAFARSWRPVMLLQLVLMVPLTVVLVLFQRAAGSQMGLTTVGTESKLEFDHQGAAIGLGIVLVVIVLVVGALVQLTSLWIVVKQAAGEAVQLRVAVRFAASRAVPVIGWQIVAAVLVAIGIVALVAPGIYLGVVLLPTLLCVVGLERRGLSRCFELARGNFLALLGRCCVAVLIAVAYSELIQVIGNAIFGRDATGWGVQAVSGLLQLPLDVAGIAFLVVTYAEARSRQAATATRELSAALDS